MRFLLALVIGVLYATGFYMIMRRSLVKLVIGLALLSHAANLLIFAAGGLVRTEPPLIAPGQVLPPPLFSDPIPQALILTAIVISFGVLAFTLVLLLQVYRAINTDDMDALGRQE
jgi:multicomponent Na+:H+ antiporter subunit C